MNLVIQGADIETRALKQLARLADYRLLVTDLDSTLITLEVSGGKLLRRYLTPAARTAN